MHAHSERADCCHCSCRLRCCRLFCQKPVDVSVAAAAVIVAAVVIAAIAIAATVPTAVTAVAATNTTTAATHIAVIRGCTQEFTATKSKKHIEIPRTQEQKRQKEQMTTSLISHLNASSGD